jgi:hypothetical protein
MILKSSSFLMQDDPEIRGSAAAGWVRIRMDNIQALAPEKIAGFLGGSTGIEFTGQSRTERYAWVQATLIQQQYVALSKKPNVNAFIKARDAAVKALYREVI